MPTITTTRPTGQIPLAQADLLASEVYAAVGVNGSGCVLEPGSPDDTITLHFDSAPNNLAVEAAIDAYPSLPASVSPQVANLIGNEHVIGAVAVGPGRSLVLDVHVHATLGTSDSYRAAWLDVYVTVNRFTTGDVWSTEPRSNDTGNVPIIKVTVTPTATTAVVSVSARLDGLLTLHEKSVKVISQGTVPAP